MRDEFLNGELFDTLQEAVILTRRFVNLYNTVWPHSALGYRPPAPQTVLQVNPLTEGLFFTSLPMMQNVMISPLIPTDIFTQ